MSLRNICTLPGLVLLTIIILIGCSGPGSSTGGNSITSPALSSADPQHSDTSTNPSSLWGFWWIHIDPDAGTWDIVPVRAVTMHANVRYFLEDGKPCKNCIKITGVTVDPLDLNEVEANIELSHPFPGLDCYTGFDVKGIAMWNGSEFWPESGLRTQDPIGEDGYVHNADGYTTVFNPADFPEGSDDPLFTYSQGNFATPVFPNSTLNPYINYITDENRHMFRAGDSLARTWEIRLPAVEPWLLGYAVCASWEPNIYDPDPPQNIPDDFPITANQPEPFFFTVSQLNPLDTLPNSQTDIEARVWDWQGNPNHVWIECPELWTGLIYSDSMTPDGNAFNFNIPILNEDGASEGAYRALIGAVDSTTPPDPFDFTNYNFFNITVEHNPCCDNPPVADITGEEPDIITEQEITLTSASFDPDGGDCTVTIDWDLDGDGTYDGVTDDEIIVSWDQPGIKHVGLQVIDSCGLQVTTVSGDINIHVGVTLEEDMEYKSLEAPHLGKRYRMYSADHTVAEAAALGVDMNNPDGPWDFSWLSVNTGNYIAVMDPSHSEVAPFTGDFGSINHFWKVRLWQGGFHNEIYVAEEYATDPDCLLWKGFRASGFSLAPDDPMEFPFPIWFFTDFEHTLQYTWFIFTFDVTGSLVGWGEGLVTTPYPDITNEPCVVIQSEVKVEYAGSGDLVLGAMIYGYYLDDGSLIAAVIAYNEDGNMNYDPITGVITGTASFNALSGIEVY